MIARAAPRISSTAAIVRLAALYLAFDIARKFVPLPRLARLAWCRSRGAHDPSVEQRFVSRVIRARRLFGDMDRDCLTRSLLLYRGLSRLGADPRLIVGFRESSMGLEGHAYVTAGSRCLDDRDPQSLGFAPALSFGRCGELTAL